VGELIHFQVYQDKTFQQVIVEDQVDEKIGIVRPYVLLAADKCKAFAQLQHEMLNMADNGAFQVFFPYR